MNALTEISVSSNWEFTSPQEKLFSSDHVIDAYLKGKNEGLEQAQRLILNQLSVNINKSGKYTTEVLNAFRKKKFNPISAFLKINSWDDFTILVVVPESEFLDPKMLSVYDFISAFEDKVTEELYSIQISICSTVIDIDESSVRSDGFVLKHKISQ